MAMVVKRRDLHEPTTDLASWLAQSPQDRLAAVETLRRAHHGRTDLLDNKRASGRAQDVADVEALAPRPD